MSIRFVVACVTAVLLNSVCPAQEKQPKADAKLVGDWKIVLALDSTQPTWSGSTTFSRLKVTEDGTCELSGTSVSNLTEKRHHEFVARGKFGPPADTGQMNLDLTFSTERQVPPSQVVYRCIAKLEHGVLIVALGPPWSESRPESFDGVTAARQKSEPKQTTSHLLVFGRESK